MRRVLAAIFLAVVASGFSRTTQAPPTFRGAIDLVHLDVSVLDANRHPVGGLTAADFTVLENGRPQAIAAFAAVDVPGPEPAGAAWLREVASDVKTNVPADRRLVVIVMDDASIQADGFALGNARKIARSVIDHLGPNDVASVVFTRDNRNAQDFTADRLRLRAAVDGFSLGFRDIGADALYFVYSAQIFGEVAKQLAEIPERRKMLLYIGQGLPLDISTASEAGTPGLSLASTELQNKLLMIVADSIQRARQANVNVYTIDACGFRVDVVGFVQGSRRTCVADGLEIPYLQTISQATGGRALVNTNDAAPGISDIFQENAAYYLLGYRSTDPAHDGKPRRLEVRVNRPGLTVRTRSGYVAEKEAPMKEPPSLLAKALSGILPTPDVALQVHVAPFARPRRDPRVAIVLGVKQTDLAFADKRVVEDLQLQVSAFTPEGRMRASQRQTARVAVRAGAGGDIQYEILTGIDLKPGRYQLRLAAESGRQRKSGSVYADVVVPDFGKQALSLSGVELAASPSPASAPKDALIDFTPIVPTSRREFGPTDVVSAFLRVYQGGKGPAQDVSLDIQVLGTQAPSQRLQGRTVAIPAIQFGATRSADQRFPLDLATLPAGSYLLSIKAATGGDSATRDVRFRIVSPR